MLRFLAVLLVAGNLLFFGFTSGWFDGVLGMHALGDREPERLAAQVRPQSIVLMQMPAAAAASAAGGMTYETAAVTKTAGCLEAGPIAAADAVLAEAALRGILPPGAWIDTRGEAPNGFTSVVTHTYRVDKADAAIAARLTALRLDPSGHSFNPCPAAVPPR
jgi:hypothetical protein